MSTTIGIDPGKEGGITCYDGETMDFVPMPLMADGRVDAIKVRWHLAGGSGWRKPRLVLVEQVNAFGMGRQSAFVFGGGFHVLLAVLDIVGVPWDTIGPKKWQAAGPGNAKGKNEQKARTVAWAMRRFPHLDWPASKKRREQLADAVGIAWAAWQQP